MQHSTPQYIKYSGAGLVLLGLLIAIPVLSDGPRDIGDLENIHGIPFVQTSSGMQVEETLAHADIYLNEPVFAKHLTLNVTFDPGTLEQLAVGVREHSFWLSYPKHVLYEAEQDAPGRQSRQIIIPLTSALQEPNRSIDLMFFGTTATQGAQDIDRKNLDDISWTLYSLDASVSPALPTWADTKDYIRSVLRKERAL